MSSTALALLPPPVAAFHRAADVVSIEAGIPVADIVNPTGRAARRARRTALYLVAVAADHGCRSVARVTGLSHVAVIKALRAVEDMRDDADFDRHLSTLEEAMACAVM